MSKHGHRYDVAAEVAARIINEKIPDYPGPKAVLYGRLLFTILDGIYEAERRLSGRLEPSEN